MGDKGYGIACPPEYPFGTKIKAFKKTWTCVDRGGMIQFVDGIPWIDFLEETGRLPHGQEHIVQIKVEK